MEYLDLVSRIYRIQIRSQHQWTIYTISNKLPENYSVLNSLEIWVNSGVRKYVHFYLAPKFDTKKNGRRVTIDFSFSFEGELWIGGCNVRAQIWKPINILGFWQILMTGVNVVTNTGQNTLSLCQNGCNGK